MNKHIEAVEAEINAMIQRLRRAGDEEKAAELEVRVQQLRQERDEAKARAVAEYLEDVRQIIAAYPGVNAAQFTLFERAQGRPAASFVRESRKRPRGHTPRCCLSTVNG
jgi:hypothetical protein